MIKKTDEEISIGVDAIFKHYYSARVSRWQNVLTIYIKEATLNFKHMDPLAELLETEDIDFKTEVTEGHRLSSVTFESGYDELVIEARYNP